MITIGRIVLYRLSANDALTITRNRALDPCGPAVEALRMGNTVKEGDIFPLLVTKTWQDADDKTQSVNGQVMLDGNDTKWVTSVHEGTEPGEWSWPPRV